MRGEIRFELGDGVRLAQSAPSRLFDEGFKSRADVSGDTRFFDGGGGMRGSFSFSTDSVGYVVVSVVVVSREASFLAFDAVGRLTEISNVRDAAVFFPQLFDWRSGIVRYFLHFAFIQRDSF